MTEIELSPREMILAAHAGVMRRVENQHWNRKGANRHDNGWHTEIEGCLGEYALSKHLNIHWRANEYHADQPDLGNSDIEARTAGDHGYRLILRTADNRDHKYYLLTGEMGTYRLHGYIWGRDGMIDRFWVDPGNGREPAYFIPQQELTQET